MAFSAPSNDILITGNNVSTYTVGEDVTRGQVVKISADNTVIPSDTDGETTAGVALQTVASGGGEVAVAEPGTEVLFTAGSGDVDAGEQLTSFGGTANEGEVNVASNTNDFVIGLSREGAGSTQDTVVGLVTLGGEQP